MQKNLIQSLRIIEISVKRERKYNNSKLKMSPFHEKLSKLDLENN